ncbi:hypothetical protein [Sulfuricella sp.]|uniref:hypothetical protein n=1 Tax=Sulfuricella sp. TaxID=2099377 RepID=UPI002BE86543|nr:hypothetical protein [Sulfuricella sp.]HUX64339.1 hypothetical protein [Sulfuricella sp.]
MATKTTSTTDNNAGCSPCTPEAHQRADGENVTCHGCINLDSKDCEAGVGWCNYHWQYRSIGTVRTCEGAQFFEDEE